MVGGSLLGRRRKRRRRRNKGRRGERRRSGKKERAEKKEEEKDVNSVTPFLRHCNWRCIMHMCSSIVMYELVYRYEHTLQN